MAKSPEPRKLRVDPKDVYSLARWFQSRPFNRNGADKTHVVKCLWNMTQFFRLGCMEPRERPDD